MGKSLRNIVLSMLILLTVLCVPVAADAGPKPSVVVNITGVPKGEWYYATLLGEESSSGPWNAGSTWYGEQNSEVEIAEKFIRYRDSDGFRFLEYYAGRNDEEQFTWAYYPPERFKILLYFPERDFFVVSDQVYEQYAFASYFDAEFHTDGTLTVERTLPTGWETVAFFLRLLLTLSVEVFLAVAFGFRKRQLWVIFCANVVTQIFLNLSLVYHGYEALFYWYVVFYGWLELLIFAAEATLYSLLLPKLAAPERGPGHPILYAFTANLLSFLLGYLISAQFPNVFR